MLISLYSIFLASIFIIFGGIISHLIIGLNGYIFTYLLTLGEMILNRTIFFTPGMIGHIQGINMYTTIIFSLFVVLSSIWINIKQYQITSLVISPFGWIFYGIWNIFSAYFSILRFGFSIFNKILYGITGFSIPLLSK